MVAPQIRAVNAEDGRAFGQDLDNNATRVPSYARRNATKETKLTDTLAVPSGWSGGRFLAGLLLLAGICGLGSWILGAHGAAIPMRTEFLWDLAYRLFLVAWVRADMRSHHFSAPYEFDAFLFFAWPAALPYYLYKTRGGRGLFAALGFWVLLTLIPSIGDLVQIFAQMR